MAVAFLLSKFFPHLFGQLGEASVDILQSGIGQSLPQCQTSGGGEHSQNSKLPPQTIKGNQFFNYFFSSLPRTFSRLSGAREKRDDHTSTIRQQNNNGSRPKKKIKRTGAQRPWGQKKVQG